MRSANRFAPEEIRLMTINKKTWLESFPPDNLPDFPCPHCGKLTLVLDQKSVTTDEPAYSKANHADENFDVDWVEERFIAFLKCSVTTCGETVAVSGRVVVEPAYDDDGSTKYVGMLEPRSMYPAPPIITLSKNTPGAVANELALAFQFYWGDFGACATKIRTSVERLMDHFKAPRYRRAKDPKKPTAPGKLKQLDLSTRIDKFISATGNVVHRDHLHALRVVGNLGTHDNVLKRSEILDAFEVYEHALSELIDKKSAVIARTAKKLQKKAGKKKKKNPWAF